LKRNVLVFCLDSGPGVTAASNEEHYEVMRGLPPITEPCSGLATKPNNVTEPAQVASYCLT
jgi:hypothetical protein